MTIHGKFAASGPMEVDVKRICKAFANWPDTPEEILRFTLQYGPVALDREPGAPFCFTVGGWMVHQRIVRNTWQMFAPPNTLLQEMKREGRIKQVGLGEGSQLIFVPEGTTFQAKSLWTILWVALGALSLDLLRVCPNPDCKSSYFVAYHPRQTFCGKKDCIVWGDLKQKREWWQRNKESQMAKRRRSKVRSKKNGTNETQ
jgi:hypothetical protein